MNHTIKKYVTIYSKDGDRVVTLEANSVAFDDSIYDYFEHDNEEDGLKEVKKTLTWIVDDPKESPCMLSFQRKSEKRPQLKDEDDSDYDLVLNPIEPTIIRTK